MPPNSLILQYFLSPNNGGYAPKGRGELTIATAGRGGQVSGLVAVVAEGPIGGVLPCDIPALGVARVGDSPPGRCGA